MVVSFLEGSRWCVAGFSAQKPEQFKSERCAMEQAATKNRANNDLANLYRN
jgi:hypothetical protein